VACGGFAAMGAVQADVHRQRRTVDSCSSSTGWRGINRTIQPFNRVYKNLHIMTHLTLVADEQIRRQKRNRSWKETKSRKNRKTAYIVKRNGKTARVLLFGIVFIITFISVILVPILSF